MGLFSETPHVWPWRASSAQLSVEPLTPDLCAPSLGGPGDCEVLPALSAPPPPAELPDTELEPAVLGGLGRASLLSSRLWLCLRSWVERGTGQPHPSRAQCLKSDVGADPTEDAGSGAGCVFLVAGGSDTW